MSTETASSAGLWERELEVSGGAGVMCSPHSRSLGGMEDELRDNRRREGLWYF